MHPEEATGTFGVCSWGCEGWTKSSQGKLLLFSPSILRPAYLSNLEGKKVKACPGLAKAPRGVRPRRITRGRHQSPVPPGPSHRDGTCYNNEGRMNDIFISLRDNCPRAWRKFVLSLHRPKSPNEANKTVALPVPMSFLPRGGGRGGIITGKGRLLADTSLVLSPCCRGHRRTGLLWAFQFPPLTYYKPARAAPLPGSQEMVSMLSDPPPCSPNTFHLDSYYSANSLRFLWCFTRCWHTLGAQ